MVDLTGERVIAVSGDGIAEALSEREWERRLLNFTPAMSAATDVLFDNGMLDVKRLDLLRAAESQGRDPEAFARHLVKLSRALRRP